MAASRCGDLRRPDAGRGACPKCCAGCAPAEAARAGRLATETLRQSGRADRLLGPHLRAAARGDGAEPAAAGGDGTRHRRRAAWGGPCRGRAGQVASPTRKRAAGLVNAVLRRVAERAPVLAEMPPAELPKALRKRLVAAWGKACGGGDGGGVRRGAAAGSDAARRRCGGAGGGPGRGGAADRKRAAGRGRAGLGAAGLRRGRVLGAGRRRGAAGAAAGGAAGRAGAGPLRRARRQDPAAGGGGGRGDRAGHLRPAARPGCARTSRAPGWRPRWSRPMRSHWQGGPFDAVLLDAPCSATGTIRRHPDLPFLQAERRPRRRSSTCRRALIDRASRC